MTSASICVCGWSRTLRRLCRVFAALVLTCCSLGQANGDEPARQTGEAGRVFDLGRRLGRGVNVLGYDPLWKSPKEARFRAEFFKMLHDAGFNHVRINLHPFRDAGGQSEPSEYYWKTLDWAIHNALDNHLLVILDLHEFLELAKDPAAKENRWLTVWRQIAQRYKNAPDEVLFELLNEPNGELTPSLWNQWLRDALAVIRQTNPNRAVIIGPGRWNSIDLLEELDLPDDDRNIIVTVHYYNPFEFTHQGTPWTDQKDKSGVVWKGNENERLAIRRDFDRAQSWATRHDRPLYLGEFGAYDKADMASRARYVGFVAREAERHGWAWAYWQFDFDFILYDVPNERWIEPLRDALIPPQSR